MSFYECGLTAERDPHDLRHQRAPPIWATWISHLIR